ncbi:protein argonaute 5-like [Alnus glutinosa]|uniref:protein argonaute 5-like n=1 Tax=Alnus glutinosa TaxID=3517 RepID=UPI002D79938E|nr:protein argonaute 5-like [Alnus glutinosa]
MSSRRGGGRQPDSRLDQPSPAAYQGGGGRGREGGGGSGRGASSTFPPAPAPEASFPANPPPSASPAGPPSATLASSDSSAASSSARPPVSSEASSSSRPLVPDSTCINMFDGRYNVMGRSFIHPELGQTGELGNGLEYWRGFYQSLRPTQMGLSLNIDVSARAFYEPILVTDFVAKHFNFNVSMPLSDQDRLKIQKALRRVKVEVTNREYSRSYKVTAVTTQPTSQLTFTLDDQGTRISVAQYYREKYNIALKNVNLPALQAGSDTKPIYLPMELCKISPGQRYYKRLNERQVTNLLRATSQRPQDRQNSINQECIQPDDT